MRRILVVDDDPQICQAIGISLRDRFEVSLADSAVNGLAALAHCTFDLMIVDMFLPDMRGFDPIRIFHHRAPNVPLIAISASTFPNSETSAPDLLGMAASLEVTRCLRKPFRGAALLEVIDECLSAAGPHRRQVVTPGAVAHALSKSAEEAMGGACRG